MTSPYYAVIFTSTRTEGDNGYRAMADKMEQLATQQPGYLGIESVRNQTTSKRISFSYWKDLESISNWKMNVEHQLAQKFGKEKWYENYKLRICKIEREYSHPA